MGELANRRRLFTKKRILGAHCGAVLASAGQLVAPSGLLFEVLFATLGTYWGPPGPKLQKATKIDEKLNLKGSLFKSFVGWWTVEVMLFSGTFF